MENALGNYEKTVHGDRKWINSRDAFAKMRGWDPVSQPGNDAIHSELLRRGLHIEPGISVGHVRPKKEVPRVDILKTPDGVCNGRFLSSCLCQCWLVAITMYANDDEDGTLLAASKEMWYLSCFPSSLCFFRINMVWRQKTTHCATPGILCSASSN